MAKKGKRRSRALTIVQKFFPKVQQVVDGHKSIEVEVTGADVKKAAKLDHGGCAMAVACKRALEADGMIISVSTAYVVEGQRATRYHVPNSVGREITSFDRGAAFAPGAYRLVPFAEANTLGARTDQGGHSQNGGKAKAPHHFTGGIRAALGRKG